MKQRLQQKVCGRISASALIWPSQGKPGDCFSPFICHISAVSGTKGNNGKHAAARIRRDITLYDAMNERMNNQVS